MTPKEIVPRFLIGVAVGVLLVLALSGVYYILASNQSPNEIQLNLAYSPDVDPQYSTSGAKKPLPPMSEIFATLKDLPRFHQVAELHGTFKNTGALGLSRSFVEAHSEVPSFLRDEMQTIIVRRLASVDPREGLKLIEGTSDRKRELLLQELFGELSILSLEDAVSLALEVDHVEDRQAIVRGMIQARDDLSTEVLLQTAGRLGAERVALDLIATSQSEQAMQDPSGSMKTFFGTHGSDIDELSSAQFDLLNSIVRSWIDQSGRRALQEVWSLLRRDRDRIQVFSRLLDNTARQDPQMGQDIAEWLESTDRNVLAQSLAVWGASAPTDALDFVQSLNLGVAQQRMERSVVESWIQSDPIAVLASVDDVTGDLRTLAERDALREMTRTTPEAVPAWIDGISDEATKEIIVNSLVENWAQRDPRSALDWIMTNDSHVGPYRWNFLSTVLPILVEDEPQLALKIALEHPQTDSEIGLEALVIGGMATVDTDQAVAELSSARNQETREAAYIEIGKSLVTKGDTESVIELAEDMAREQQFRYYNGFAAQWALTNPDDLLQNLDRLPSRDIQLLLVRETLRIDSILGTLSPEQRTELNAYISEQEDIE